MKMSGAGGGTRHPRYGEHAGTSVWGHAPGRTPPAPANQSGAEVARTARTGTPASSGTSSTSTAGAVDLPTSASDRPVEAGATVTTPSGVSLGEGRPLPPPRPFQFRMALRFPNDPEWLADRGATTTITVAGDVL